MGLEDASTEAVKSRFHSKELEELLTAVDQLTNYLLEVRDVVAKLKSRMKNNSNKNGN